jgi:hypothetical protein
MTRKKTGIVTIAKNRATWFLRSLNSSRRVLPDFIIIGAAKGGTTSLFNYLVMHPQVAEPLKKEVHYFDRNFHKGVNWYRMHFPTSAYMEQHSKGSKFVTGEASPYYLSHPLAAIRIRELLPKIKMIALLRNPIDRAISNYQHMVRLGIENETLERALELEQERTAGEREKLLSNGSFYSFSHHHFSYLARGLYATELEPWFDHFPKEQFLITSSEAFYANPAQVFTKSLEFIGLDNWHPPHFKTFNSGGEYTPINPELRTRLSNFFKPHNERLFEIINTRFDWD